MPKIIPTEDSIFWVLCSRYDQFATVELFQKAGEKYADHTGKQYDPKGILKHCCCFHNRNKFDEAKAKGLVDKLNSKGGLKKV